jgi:hypothetical protein
VPGLRAPDYVDPQPPVRVGVGRVHPGPGVIPDPQVTQRHRQPGDLVVRGNRRSSRRRGQLLGGDQAPGGADARGRADLGELASGMKPSRCGMTASSAAGEPARTMMPGCGPGVRGCPGGVVTRCDGLSHSASVRPCRCAWPPPGPLPVDNSRRHPQAWRPGLTAEGLQNLLPCPRCPGRPGTARPGGQREDRERQLGDSRRRDSAPGRPSLPRVTAPESHGRTGGAEYSHSSY